MKIIVDKQFDFCDVLIKPRYSNIASRKDVNITRKYNFKWSGKTVQGTGIMNANMGTIGTFKIAKAMLNDGLFTCLHKYHSVNDLLKFYKNLNDDEFNRCFLSIGLKDNGLEKIEQITNEIGEVIPICIDVPNGYIVQVKELVKQIRKKYPDCILMTGNVVTEDIVEDLILSGADIIKCGISGGAQCITRKITGVGRPQLSTVIECSVAAHNVGGMICSDGGITCAGDIGKAFGGGADFIMIGSLYAGTDEADGEIIKKQIFNGEYDKIDVNNIAYKIEPHLEEKKFKQFYGMSSTYAQEKFGNGKPRYRASEGRVTLVPYIGSIKDVNEEFLGGLRSTMTYIGAKNLEDISKCCTFYLVNRQLNTTYESTTIGK